MKQSASRLAAGLICAGLLSSLVSMSSSARAGDDDTLNVYNFSMNIGRDTIRKFEKETGIKVRYDIYDTDDTLLTKLMVGHSNYDVVFPSSSYFIKEMGAGLFAKLDQKKIPNAKNIDPQITKALMNVDPKASYAMPYIYGVTGVAYNATEIRKRLGSEAPVDSWDLIFDPKWVAKLKSCGVSLVDNGAETATDALLKLRLNPNSKSPADYKAAFAHLKKIRPYVSQFNSSTYIDEMANGSLCVSTAFSGDVLTAKLRAKEAGHPVDLKFVIPKEGAPLWITLMAIPADAPHMENAQKFINFLLRPDIAAEITTEIKFPSAVKTVRNLVSPDIANDTMIYPSDADRSRLVLEQDVPPAITRLINREFTEFKAGR
ncbi:extracellular solute-binding protein [Chromobacterium haemolyticum]|uniref:extracellular solute-binding protein n=1 Tax=Chromobacterium haemolyticum TaxID=394935 RepID=UPI0017465A32|nr:extracellular solute-binding protein [Chromobacterium haemolyticum]QOD84373.1 extracellular solute-binding protein [Chromobacterium haemolyticum]